MQEPSSQPQDPSETESDSDVSCQLIIQADLDGIVGYSCDWIPGEEGLIGLASIFYKLLVDNFGEQVFEEIKQQCVLNNAEEDYITIVSLINSKTKPRESDNDVVVPPDQIFNI